MHNNARLFGLILLIFEFSVCIATDESSQFFGLNLGSVAAAKIAKYVTQYKLRRPHKILLDVKNQADPWFNPLAQIDSQIRLLTGPLDIHFTNNQVTAELEDVTLKSAAEINFLTLPFLLGGDTIHINVTVERVYIRLQFETLNVKLDQCSISTKSVRIYAENGCFLNLLLSASHYFIPDQKINRWLCSTISDALLDLRNRFSLGIPFAVLLPEKFHPYLTSQNTFLYARLQSVLANDEKLTINAIVDWFESPTYQSTTRKITYDNDNNNSTYSQKSSEDHIAADDVALDNHISAEHTMENEQDQVQHASASQTYISPKDSELLDIWIDGELLNQLLQKFNWNFKWVDEELHLNSTKIPAETSNFLMTLCTKCILLINVTANGIPTIEISQNSIIIKLQNRLAVSIQNPNFELDHARINKIAKAIDFALTLIVKFSPEIEDGVFRTHFDLVDKKIEIMEGSALPPYLFQPISETISKTISEDIWPALHRALKPFIYDGVKIPSHCGIRPDSAKFHFDGGRIGVSVLLDLDNFAKNYCIHHLKTNLPKISVIDTSRINSSLVS